MTKNKIKLKCQALWEQATDKPIKLYFSTKKEMQRARFTLYDSIKPAGIPLEQKEKFANLKEQCEITTNIKGLVLTIQKREENPFYENFVGELDKALEGGQVHVQEEKGDDSMKESLGKLNKLLEKDSAEVEERPMETPYFTREG